MTVELVARSMYHCICRYSDCGYDWHALERPDRCAGCKRRAWDGEDGRLTRWSGPVRVKADKVPPALQVRAIFNALTSAKDIISQLVAELGPCDHSKKDQCYCHEREALDKIDKQITHLKQFTRRQA